MDTTHDHLFQDPDGLLGWLFHKSWGLEVDKTHLQIHPAQMRAGSDSHWSGLHYVRGWGVTLR